MTEIMNISYLMNIVDTKAATGYFTCTPSIEMDMEELLDLIESRPMDTFLHRYALERLCGFSADDFMAFLKSVLNEGAARNTAALAMFAEACLINPDFRSAADSIDFRKASSATPLVDLRSHLMHDTGLHNSIISVLEANIVSHLPLKKDDSAFKIRDSFLVCNTGYDAELEAELKRKYIHIETVHIESSGTELDFPRRFVSSAGALSMASARLEKAGVHVEAEMRHVSSLSPIAIMRKWKLERKVESGRNMYDLSGIHTAYGKGLNPDDARASCIMEVVERYSSYYNIKKGCIDGCIREYPLVYGRFHDIENALDPSLLRLEVPYSNEPLWWMDADRISPDGTEKIRIPVQTAFLFSNLDEPDLFSGLGSTGLAAHTDMIMAKTAALLECIERDSDTVSIFVPEKCFTVETRDPELAHLFSAYASRGISIQFQDISTEMGIPCFRCFVRGKNGAMTKGTGAGLSCKKALLSALFETPYPFPYGPPSNSFNGNLPSFVLEDLPDYSDQNPYRDLYLMEKTLVSNGYCPVYADLTRRDIDLPVVRAMIPGLEIMNDFDRFSRVSPRMLKHYIKASE